MDVAKVETQKRATATTLGEDKIRELIRGEAQRAAVANDDTNGETSLDAIAPLVRKVGAASIAGMEKLISELDEARNFLKSEGERVQREAAHFANLTQTADASVKIISESLREWRTANDRRNSKAA
jgi:hypothetical protein